MKYDHFARDCPACREEKEIEQVQQMLNLGNEQLITLPMSNTQAELSRVSSEENLRVNHLNLWKVGMAPLHFYLSAPKIGGLINDKKPSIGQYLTREQAIFAYKNTELGKMINTETQQQELENEWQLNKIDDTSGDTNLARK